MCGCTHTCVCIYVHMPIYNGFSEKWDGDCFQWKPIWSLILVETSEDPLVLVNLVYLALPAWRKKWQSTPVFLPGKSHGQKSQVGYSPWGCEELDMTK